MSATISTTTTVSFQGEVTVSELASILEDLPQSATVRFTVHPGDARDPSYTTLTVTHGRSR